MSHSLLLSMLSSSTIGAGVEWGDRGPFFLKPIALHNHEVAEILKPLETYCYTHVPIIIHTCENWQ